VNENRRRKEEQEEGKVCHSELVSGLITKNHPKLSLSNEGENKRRGWGEARVRSRRDNSRIVYFS